MTVGRSECGRTAKQKLRRLRQGLASSFISLLVGINRGPQRNIFVSLKTALTIDLRDFVKPIPLKAPKHPCKVPP